MFFFRFIVSVSGRSRASWRVAGARLIWGTYRRSNGPQSRSHGHFQKSKRRHTLTLSTRSPFELLLYYSHKTFPTFGLIKSSKTSAAPHLPELFQTGQNAVFSWTKQSAALAEFTFFTNVFCPVFSGEKCGCTALTFFRKVRVPGEKTHKCVWSLKNRSRWHKAWISGCYRHVSKY